MNAQQAPATPKPLRLICSWCEHMIRDGELPESHGICQPCKAIHFPKGGKS